MSCSLEKYDIQLTIRLVSYFQYCNNKHPYKSCLRLRITLIVAFNIIKMADITAIWQIFLSLPSDFIQWYGTFTCDFHLWQSCLQSVVLYECYINFMYFGIWVSFMTFYFKLKVSILKYDSTRSIQFVLNSIFFNTALSNWILSA